MRVPSHNMKVFPSLSLLDFALSPSVEVKLQQITHFLDYSSIARNYTLDCQMLDFFVNLTCLGEDLSTLLEKQNLFSSWSFLCHLIGYNLRTDPESRGWLDITWLKQLHFCLMKDGLIDETMSTGPGLFSFAPRSAEYHGKLHFYPHFKNNKEWFDAIQPIFDRFNALIQHVKQYDGSLFSKILNACKCAAWILYQIVSLHPFSDGNGRLSRLLAAYTLSIFCPFPCAIFKISDPSDRDFFIQSLIFARDHHDDISPLTELVVESVWFSFLIFFAQKIMFCLQQPNILFSLNNNNTLLQCKWPRIRQQIYLQQLLKMLDLFSQVRLE